MRTLEAQGLSLDFVATFQTAILVLFVAVYVAVGIVIIPFSIGVAVLRYHLFDIDVLVNRTLVYGALTGVLALVYIASIALLESLLRVLTGQDNDLAIIISTLAIAVLFNPLRRRIQAFIDQRFYRRKYDAEQVLAAFNRRLRDEVDLHRLSEALLAVVEETMQPASVSLWLREPPLQTQERPRIDTDWRPVP